MAHIHDKYDFTASAFVMHPTEPKFALVLHNKYGKWMQPGGHIELDETPLQGLIHEIEEETGLKSSEWEFVDQPDRPPSTPDIELLPLPFTMFVHEMDYLPGHFHIDSCHLVQAKTDRLTDHPDGASDIGWFSIGELRKLHKRGLVYDNILVTCEWIAKKYFVD